MKVAAVKVTADDGKTFHRAKQQKTTSTSRVNQVKSQTVKLLSISLSCYSGLGSLRCVLPHIECPPAIALVCFRIPFALSAILIL